MVCNFIYKSCVYSLISLVLMMLDVLAHTFSHRMKCYVCNIKLL